MQGFAFEVWKCNKAKMPPVFQQNHIFCVCVLWTIYWWFLVINITQSHFGVLFLLKTLSKLIFSFFVFLQGSIFSCLVMFAGSRKQQLSECWSAQLQKYKICLGRVIDISYVTFVAGRGYKSVFYGCFSTPKANFFLKISCQIWAIFVQVTSKIKKYNVSLENYI